MNAEFNVPCRPAQGNRASVIPTGSESFFQKDSRRAGMTKNSLSAIVYKKVFFYARDLANWFFIFFSVRVIYKQALVKGRL